MSMPTRIGIYKLDHPAQVSHTGWGQMFHIAEAGIESCVKGECVEASYMIGKLTAMSELERSNQLSKNEYQAKVGER